MDDDYIRRRAARMAKAQRPQSLRDGVNGAIVGVAQGVVGVPTKAAAGVLDLAAKSADSLSPNMARAGGDRADRHVPPPAAPSGRARARPPRALGPEAVLQVYDESHSARQEVLMRVDAGLYRGETLGG